MVSFWFPLKTNHKKGTQPENGRATWAGARKAEEWDRLYDVEDLEEDRLSS